ncbi:aminoglycoside phosphotransferase family protein [Amnibacterium endophyticum]|uniref:Aminoglycoside phosphotransferase family protein n=1 Tax=Amnibacterium endophyticum TaxID=2109337 RepID=A0ABW4LHQ7_9MICO
MPAADIEAGPEIARALLEEQHPDLARLPLVPVAEGWDNVVLRLGDDLAVRLPRRRVAAALIRHEQLALPAIAARVPVAVPAPVRVGTPTDRFPFPWSVVPWFAGGTVADAGMREDAGLAEALAAFLAALHVPDEAAPENPVRGVPLAARATAMTERLAALDDPRLDARWREALDAAPWSGPRLRLHGDLHPANLVQRDGRLTAVVDFGDTGGGDPATDVATAWLTFGPGARERFRAALAPDAATWTRARGWALCMAAAHVIDGGPTTAAIGRAALSQVLA